MNKPKVSVVIPVYKVEEFLSRCVESVLCQTLSDLEIILVDDGSPDNCPKICDEYGEKYPNIIVVHKENGGLASARNAGMRVAKGKYLFFLDSDDWLDQDGLEILYNTAEEQNVDFVRYRLIRTNWPGMEENAPCMFEPIRELRGGYYSAEDIKKEVYPRLITTNQMTMGAIVGSCGSLYKLEFLRENNIEFYEEVKFSEDLVFSARVVKAAKSFFYIEKAGIYHYFFNSASISKSFRAGRWDSCKEIIKTCERDFGACDDYDFSSQLHCLRWFCIMLSLNEKYHIKNKKERKTYCKGIINDPVVRNTPLNLKDLNISFKLKIKMILVKIKAIGLVSLI